MAQIQVHEENGPGGEEGQAIPRINLRIVPGNKPDAVVGDDIFDYDTDGAGNKTWPIPYFPNRDYTLLINATDVNPAFETKTEYLPRPGDGKWNDVRITLAKRAGSDPFDPGAAVVRTGTVIGDGRAIRDRQGNFNARGITGFVMPFMLEHDPTYAHQTLAWMRDRRLDFAVVWGKVGGGSWADREFGPRDADYNAYMARFIDTAYDRYGVRTWIAYVADNYDGVDPVDGARQLVDVIRGREEKIMGLEAANEDNMPDEGRNLKLVCDVFRSAFPSMLVVARCAPVIDGPSLDVDAYAAFANCASGHLDRSLPMEKQIRQAWDYRDSSRPVISREPAGPWSSIAELTDPLGRALMSFNDGVCGFAMDVYHNGPLIRSGGAWDRGRGIPAHVWDIPNVDAQVSGMMAMAALLPADIANWSKFNGHWPGHPMPAKWVWTDGFAEGVNRIYAAVKGNDFYCAAIAVQGNSIHFFPRDSRIDVIHPVTGEVLETAEVQGGDIHIGDDNGKRVITGDGESFTLKGPEAGGLWGYAIRGRYL